MATPSAAPSGIDPGLCATNGTKFDHEPRCNTIAQTVRNPNTPSFSHVIHRMNPALNRVLRMLRRHKAQIKKMAAILTTRGDQ